MKKNKKQKTNADVLKAMIDINDAYKIEHDGESLLTEKVEEEIKSILKASDDSDVINVKFNKILKATEPKK